MPVSGNEQPGVLSRKSSDNSAGMPLKKRRSLLEPPPSPPRQESLPALSGENDVKKNVESSSDLTNKEQSGSASKGKEESYSYSNKKEESNAYMKNKEESGSDLKNKIESIPDLKKNEESSSDQGASNINVAKDSRGISEVSKIDLLEVKKEIDSAPNANLAPLGIDVSRLQHPKLNPMFNLSSEVRDESRTKLLLTGKSASFEVPRTAVGAVLTSVKKEIHSKQVEEECKLKLSTGSGNDKLEMRSQEPLVPGLGHQNTERISQMHDNVDPSLLSLSLSKGKSIMQEKSVDTSLNSDSKYAFSSRSNWDLNSPMDAWEGSIGDTAFQGTVDGKTTTVNNRRSSLISTPVVTVCSEKRNQITGANEPRSSFPNSCHQLSQQSEDSLCLTLSPSFREIDFSRELSGVSVKVPSRMDAPRLQSGLLLTVNNNSNAVGLVKPEPIDGNSKKNSIEATDSSMKLLDFNSVKREPSEKRSIEAVELSASNPQKLTEEQSIKSEPTIEISQELGRTGDVALQQSSVTVVHSHESGSSSSVLPVPLTPQKPSPSRLPTSSELSTNTDVSNKSEHSVHTTQVPMVADVLVQAATDLTCKPVYHRAIKANVAGQTTDTGEAEVKKIDDSEMQRIKEHSHDLCVNGEGSVSGEEKINISAETMEDESYGSDYESDGNQAFGSHLAKQDRSLRDDDDYEDGEVREPLVHSTIEDPTDEGIDAETAKLVDWDNKDSPSGFSGDANADQSYLHDKENDLKIHSNMTVDCIRESVGTVSIENDAQVIQKDGFSQKLLSDGMVATGADEKELSNSSPRNPLDGTGTKSSLDGIDKDISCDGTTSSGRRVTTADEAKGEIVKAVNMAEKPDSPISIVEASLNDKNAVKDSSGGGNKSRIITLPRASVPSPSKIRSIPDRLLSSRSGREKYSDLDGEKFLSRENRDEIYSDSRPHRFIRERIQDQSFRSSRLNNIRGRGKFPGHLDTSRSEWGSDRDFALGRYHDDYHFTRNERATDIAYAELENDYVIAPDGAALSTGRGRKSLNDDLPSFRHLSSRRQSPGGRDGPAGRDIQMLRRISRNISPNRRNDENGVDLVGLRHDEKFVRGLLDDVIDPVYSRPHSMYDGGDSHFVRGNRNFSTFQRRGFPRVGSKSPVGLRTRSPGPWSSPRRRSPEGYSGPQHRSQAMYRVERMRSPDPTCFPEEMVARRRGSPSYSARRSNDTKNVDTGREHDHPRPINSSRRSPSDRVFSRSTRRLDVLDPQMRTGNDEYFGRPVHSRRFHEFHGDGSSDERRKFGERRGMIRSPRPPYIGDSDNPRFHLDDGPMPFRYEADTEFVGRGIREREFDGRMKSRPVVPPRRIRSIDDQEGSYRHSGQVWEDNEFNEGSGFKRRKF